MSQAQKKRELKAKAVEWVKANNLRLIRHASNWRHASHMFEEDTRLKASGLMLALIARAEELDCCLVSERLSTRRSLNGTQWSDLISWIKGMQDAGTVTKDDTPLSILRLKGDGYAPSAVETALGVIKHRRQETQA